MNFIYKTKWFCRWCSKCYTPQNLTERDGWCSTKCKQAHHRAHKRYVTQKRPAIYDHKKRVTQPKKKTSKKTPKKGV